MQKSNHETLLFRLKKLLISKTVLHVGAHPDDEEIGLLSYISFKHYGRAVYFSATRGDSRNQTAISNPQFLRYHEARCVYFGAMTGSAYGEPFFHQGPIPALMLPGIENTRPDNGGQPVYKSI